MTIEDFKDKRITVMGVGLHGGGVGVIKFLAQHGAKVLATDLRTKDELKESLELLKDLPVDFVLGKHRLEDFTKVDMVIKNPGVPENSKFLVAAKKHKVPVESDIGIFFELCPAPIIGVTGTKGKSTTATLIAHLLKQKYPQVILAGNIRSSVLENLPKISKDSVVVLELSSWQLADAKNHKKSPHISVITNIFPDHLNRYSSFEDYVEDKKLVFKFQDEKDFLFLNYNEKNLRELANEAKSRVYFYSPQGDDLLLMKDWPSLNQEPRLGAYQKRKKIYFGMNQEEVCELKEIKLLGRHAINNILAAVSVAKLFDLENSDIRLALADFKGLAGRLELIAEKRGVKFFNDTTATAPEAAMAALEALGDRWPDLKKRLILIAGGADKDLEFSNFAKKIVDSCLGVILLEGTATPKLEKEITKAMEAAPENNFALFEKTDDLEKGVKKAVSLAKRGSIILLSPGCASFGLFKHEFDRGEKFNEAVGNLK